MIESYQFGRIVIGKKNYTTDLKIIDGRVVSSWWRKSGHAVEVSDIEDILNSAVEVLVVGKGDPGQMRVTDSLKKELKKRGIELIEKPTAEAYVIFNHHYEKGRKVAGAFHLTC